MRIAVFESKVVVICSSAIAEEDKQRAPTASIAIGRRLVFESEALVTLVSVVADGTPLLFPIPSSYFADVLSFGLPPLRLPEALFFRSSLWPSLWTAYRSDFRSVPNVFKLPSLRKGEKNVSPDVAEGEMLPTADPHIFCVRLSPRTD